jgi:hypothetical protein
MRKIYSTPILRSQRIKLGVFGDYGQEGGGGGTNIDPVPIKIIDTFELHLE